MPSQHTYLSELQHELQAGEDLDPSAELEALYEATDPGDLEPELETDEDAPLSEYGQRFLELSRLEFESPAERNHTIDETLDEMERKFFFGKLFKKIKRGGLKGLVKKAAGLAGKMAGSPLGALVPGLGSVTQLARGNLKGFLGALAKDGLNAMMPGAGAIAGPALGALGLQEMGDPGRVRREWAARYSELAQRAFENLADNITDQADSLAEASQAATSALQRAAAQVSARRLPVEGSRNTRHLRLKSGDRLVLYVD